MSTDIIKTHCSPEIEYLTLKCRPFYAPRDFTVILITAVYIPPQANAKLALEELHNTINSQLNAYPEAAVIIAVDFNHVDLKIVMPKLYSNVHFPTRDKNILDQVYTNIPGAYKAILSSHLGLSDHISIEMIPSYRPLFSSAVVSVADSANTDGIAVNSIDSAVTKTYPAGSEMTGTDLD